MGRRDWSLGLYVLNSALLFTHEVDSGFWREWELLRLPGGLAGFLAANFALFVAVQVGFRSVAQRRPSRRVWMVLLGMAGIIAGILHGAFLAAGTPQFREAFSMGLLGVWFVTSIAQIVASSR